MEKIRRGDLFSYDFGDNKGSIQSGKRPVLVIQADDFNVKAPTVIVAAVTSVIKKQYLPSHVILPLECGLNQQSMVLLEQLRAVNRDELKQKIGFCDDADSWRQINNGIKKAFGLWFYKRERTGDIRCLCPKCLQDYTSNPSYIVKRLDPFSGKKEHCDKCDGLGYEYLVYDKKSVR